MTAIIKVVYQMSRFLKNLNTYLSIVPAMKYTIGKQQMASKKWLSGLWEKGNIMMSITH